MFQVHFVGIIMRTTQRDNSSQRLASLSTLFPVSGIKSRAIRKSRLFLCSEEKTGVRKQKIIHHMLSGVIAIFLQSPRCLGGEICAGRC